MILEECGIIPEWLLSNLDKKCPYCGSPYHVGLSPDGNRITKHYCPNRECPATVAMKMVYIWDILDVDGIKYGRSMELIKRNGIKRHMDAIPYVIKGKPKVNLATFMRMNCIYSVDKAWESICQGKKSVEEVLSSVKLIGLIDEYDKQAILDAQKYVEIVYPEELQYDPVFSATVMITGDIMGVPRRELFIEALNRYYKGLLNLKYAPSKRKTGIFALIKEESSPITGKVTIAMENNIPIYTPSQFVEKIHEIMKTKAGNKI